MSGACKGPKMSPLTLAFGSCHSLEHARLHPSSSILTTIASLKPDAWLWSGDSIYPESSSANDLREEYGRMKEYGPYKSLVEAVEGRVYGTWDDHDYGLNDAGRFLDFKEQRRELYNEFIGMDESADTDGVYNRVSLVSEGNEISIINLDTRHNRDSHFIPSVGGLSRLPFGAVIAAFVRLLTSAFGLGENYQGDVLGEHQWEWLADSLCSSKDGQHAKNSVNLIVSSIQLLTTNPLVESWSHFPASKKRLLSLIDSKCSGQRVAVISGDVHHSETASLPNGLVEVTSSGLTHTCATPFYGFVCLPMLRFFGDHRSARDGFYTGFNFGMITLTNLEAYAEVFDEAGEVVMRAPIDHIRGASDATIMIDGKRMWRLYAVLVAAVVAVGAVACVRLCGKAKKEEEVEVEVEVVEKEEDRAKDEGMAIEKTNEDDNDDEANAPIALSCNCPTSFLPAYLLKGGSGGAVDMFMAGSGMGCYKCK